MGVCVACSSAVDDDKMTDDLCENCAGETATPTEAVVEPPKPDAVVEEVPSETFTEEAPAETPAE